MFIEAPNQFVHYQHRAKNVQIREICTRENSVFGHFLRIANFGELSVLGCSSKMLTPYCWVVHWRCWHLIVGLFIEDVDTLLYVLLGVFIWWSQHLLDLKINACVEYHAWKSVFNWLVCMSLITSCFRFKSAEVLSKFLITILT